MKPLFILYIFLSVQTVIGQQFKIVYKNHKDSSQNFYIARPPHGIIKGLLVLNDRALSDSAKMKAYEMGIMTLTVVPVSNSLYNLTSDSLYTIIDKMIGEVTADYKLSKNKVIIGGMSAAGTGAIRYAQYCFSNKTKAAIKPVAVFAVDPPLDYERLWNEAVKSIQRNFSKDAVEESKTLVKLLKEKLRGTPKTNVKSYRVNSPFCYSAINGGNAFLLSHLSVRLYTEPDINWWINNRRKDFYDINTVDEAALINQLKLNGNDNAELIITNNRGYREDGSRHPHSWSVLDEMELLLWCDKLFTDKNTTTN